jgi:hypothetical protein
MASVARLFVFIVYRCSRCSGRLLGLNGNKTKTNERKQNEDSRGRSGLTKARPVGPRSLTWAPGPRPGSLELDHGAHSSTWELGPQSGSTALDMELDLKGA